MQQKITRSEMNSGVNVDKVEKEPETKEQSIAQALLS
jgi:hypothetical protein